MLRNDRLEECLARAQAVAARVVEPSAEAWDREAAWPEAAVRALQEDGLAGLLVPEELGGLGLGMLALARVCEVLGRSDASTALCFGMHCVGTACLVAKATDDHVERFVRPIVAGRHWTTLALSEPGTGSHFYFPQASMSAENGSYALAGTKCFVTNGGHADSYVVSTAARDGEPGHLSLVMVPADEVEGRWGAPWDGWGMRGNSSRSMRLDGAKVPVANRLGEEGDEIWYVFRVVTPLFLMAMSGTYLGIAARALEEVRSHLARRVYSHTGASPAEADVVQHRLGSTWARVQCARRLCHWAAAEADAGRADALAGVLASKAEVGRAVVDTVNECMTLAGGIAYREGAVLQRLLRDARAAHVMAPTTDVLFTWVGRALLDLPLLGR